MCLFSFAGGWGTNTNGDSGLRLPTWILRAGLWCSDPGRPRPTHALHRGVGVRIWLRAPVRPPLPQADLEQVVLLCGGRVVTAEAVLPGASLTFEDPSGTAGLGMGPLSTFILC